MTQESAVNWFILKTEPMTFSVDDLREVGTTPWDGVRNFEASKILRQHMAVGDQVFIYHSGRRSQDSPAVVGMGQVVSEAYADPSQWQQEAPGFDPRSTPQRPRWWCRDIAYVRHLDRPIPLAELCRMPELAATRLCQRGNRLSVVPIAASAAARILALGAF